MCAHIIFDIDGTLLDSGEAVVNSLMRVSQELTQNPVSEYVCRKTLAMNTREALGYIGVPEYLMKKAVARYIELYAVSDRVTVFPGIMDVLKQLEQRKVRLGILSARDEYEFEADSSFAILKPYFPVLMGANYGAPKPSPISLLRYTKQHHITASEILYIGDTVKDSLTAQNASVRFALAGWNKTVDVTAVAHQYLFRHPNDIIRFVDGVL